MRHEGIFLQLLNAKVSIAKISMDAGKSPEYIQRQMVTGKYDKDDEWKV